MTREEQLKYCMICKKQKFDIKHGIVCSLTNQIADFEDSCNYFEEDSKLKENYESEQAENVMLKKIAGKGKRLANYLIDLIFYIIFSYIFGFIIGILLFFISPSTIEIFTTDNVLINYALGFITGVIYYSILEDLTGRTIAKFITRTKVVSENGDKPSYGAILLRSICRFIPFEPFSFLGSQTSGWHDRLSKTVVIENK